MTKTSYNNHKTQITTIFIKSIFQKFHEEPLFVTFQETLLNIAPNVANDFFYILKKQRYYKDENFFHKINSIDLTSIPKEFAHIFTSHSLFLVAKAYFFNSDIELNLYNKNSNSSKNLNSLFNSIANVEKFDFFQRTFPSFKKQIPEDILPIFATEILLAHLNTSRKLFKKHLLNIHKNHHHINNFNNDINALFDEFSLLNLHKTKGFDFNKKFSSTYSPERIELILFNKLLICKELAKTAIKAPLFFHLPVINQSITNSANFFNTLIDQGFHFKHFSAIQSSHPILQLNDPKNFFPSPYGDANTFKNIELFFNINTSFLSQNINVPHYQLTALPTKFSKKNITTLNLDSIHCVQNNNKLPEASNNKLKSEFGLIELAKQKMKLFEIFVNPLFFNQTPIIYLNFLNKYAPLLMHDPLFVECLNKFPELKKTSPKTTLKSSDFSAIEATIEKLILDFKINQNTYCNNSKQTLTTNNQPPATKTVLNDASPIKRKNRL